MSIYIAGGNYEIGLTERGQRHPLSPEADAIAGRLAFQELVVLPGVAAGSDGGPGNSATAGTV